MNPSVPFPLQQPSPVVEDMLEEHDGKIIIFSEWVRMLEPVRGRIEDPGVDYAWHTGSVSRDRRRIDINRFKGDPECRMFLSSESGGVGLNLQVANNVVNLDLPSNPAKLEQRIARAWRKHRKRSVTVVNLVTADSVEHRMLSLPQQKQAIADNVLDGHSNQTEMKLPSGRKAFMERLESIMNIEPAPRAKKPSVQESLMDRITAVFGDNLFAAELRQASTGGDVMLVVVNPSESIEDADIALEPHEPQLEIIDKGTYEAMLRLESIGLINFQNPVSTTCCPPPINLKTGWNRHADIERRPSDISNRRNGRGEWQHSFQAAGSKLRPSPQPPPSPTFRCERLRQITVIRQMIVNGMMKISGKSVRQ